MLLGVNTWLWESPYSTDNLDLLDKIADLGFDLVEIGLDDPEQIDPEKLSQKLDHQNLDITFCGSFGPRRDISHEDKEIRENGIKYIKTALDLCNEVDASVFAGPAYSAVGKSRHLPQHAREAERDRAIKNLGRCANYAEEVGIDLAIEPLNRFETDMVNTVQEAKEIINEVKSSNLKLHLDTFHMNIEENNFARAIENAGSLIAHFHASENNRGAPGSGHIPWDQISTSLIATGYNGAVVIESFIPDVEEIARAASIWRTLAPSSEQLAKDGLHFLQDHFET